MLSLKTGGGEFFRHTDNNKELFSYLSREVITTPTYKQVISTLLEDVVCRLERDREGLAPCSHEEADSRMMVHVADTAKQYNTVTIHTVDSDVVVLCMYVFAQSATTLTSLWVAFSTPNHNLMNYIIHASMYPQPLALLM